MPAPRAMPSREEIMEYIRQVAAQYGIDPETFLRIVEGESQFDPAARGDLNKQGVPQSVGLTQLFSGGLAPDFTEKTGGLDPADPNNWRQTIDHMAQYATQTQGKKRGGWEPWHAAAKLGIKDDEGLPRGQATGRRGRAGEVAQTTGPMVPPMFVQPVGSVKEKRSELPQAPKDQDRVAAEWKPKTLGGLAANKIFGYQPEPDKWGNYNEDAKLGSLVSMFTDRQKTGVDKEAAGVAALAKGTSPYAITGDVASQVQRRKKENKMATLADYFYPTQLEEDPNRKKTLGGALFSMFS